MNLRWKRSLAWVLSVSIALTIPGTSVYAESLKSISLQNSVSELESDSETKTVSYLDENGEIQTIEAKPLAKSGTMTLSEGWYVAEGNDFDKYTLYSVSKGHVRLILADGCDMNLVNGISVSQFMGGSLTIYAQSQTQGTMGKLTITSSTGAAIGNSSVAGDITINGGEITATTTGEAAAIGSGKGKSGGKITINGGIVTAKATGTSGVASGGAAIGGGPSKGGSTNHGGDGGNITINGGIVSATSVGGGAGIGGGSGSGTSNGGSGGNIIINGGTVYAESTNGGAGIGGGSGSNSGKGGTSGNITITGGNVTAISSAIKVGFKSTYKGAGIGSGHGGQVSENQGNITITGGNVKATGGGDQYAAGAGIGGGHQTSGGIISISGGTVTATSGNSQYADIGVGSKANESGTEIQITGGTIYSSNGQAQLSHTPTNGVTPVYYTSADLTGVYTENSLVTEASLNGYSFHDVYVDGNRTVHLYLPAGQVSANFKGTEYTGTVSEQEPNQLKKVGLSLTVEIGEVTTNTAQLHVTAAAGSTVYYVESDTALTDPKEVIQNAGSQKITVGNGSETILLKDLSWGKEYHYYLVAELNGKYSDIAAVTVTPAAVSLEDAQVVLGESNFVYDGTEQKPSITVTLNEKTLEENKDYTVSYTNTNGRQGNIVNAGTITVTVTGIGQYTGTASSSATYEIAQKTISATVEGSVSKVYDGTRDIQNQEGLKVVLQELLPQDKVTAQAGSYTYDTPDVGEDKAVTAHDVTLSGEDAANYCLEGAVTGSVGTITKSKPGFEFHNYGDKTYDGDPMPVPTVDQLTVTGGGDFSNVTFQWYQSDSVTPMDSAPVDAGEYLLKVSINGTSNTEEAFEFYPIEIRKAIYQGEQSAVGTVTANTPGSVLLPNLPEGAVYGLPHTDEQLVTDLAVQNGQLTYIGSAQVTEDIPEFMIYVPVIGAKNYEDYNVIVTLSGKDPVSVAVTMDQIVLENKTYDGQPLSYTGEATADGYTGSFVYQWYNEQGEVLPKAPVNAGTYQLKASVAEPGFVGSGEKMVTIDKAQLVIKAENKEIYVGNSMPELTFTVQGLVHNDTLVKEPELFCEVNLSQPGSYEITISGADAGKKLYHFL